MSKLLRFWLHSFMQGQFAEASTYLRNCLQAIGRPLPTSKFDLAASLFWQLLRQGLNRVYIGRWLSLMAGGLWRKITKEDVKKSNRDAAYVYHKLHQLHLTG